MNYLAELFGVAGQVMQLDPGALRRSGYLAHPWAVAIGLVTLAALSTFLGQIAVMAINQIRGLRLLFSLAVAVIGFIAQYVVQGVVLWGVGMMLMNSAPPLETVVQTILLSTAPRLFGFLIMLPYSGAFVGWLLSVWSLLVLWSVVEGAFGVGLWPAFGLTLLSWLAMNLTARALSRPLGWLRDKVWWAVTGRSILLTADDILGRYPLDEEQWRKILFTPVRTTVRRRRRAAG